MASKPTSAIAGASPSFPAPTTPAPTSANSPPASPIMEGRESPDFPLTMSASTVLMALPHDATAALAAAGKFPVDKVILRFKPIGSAPPLPSKREQVRVTSTQKFESVVAYLRKILGVKEHESLFLYVNSAFAPSLDEVVGNLWTVRMTSIP